METGSLDMIFPSKGTQVLSFLIYILGVSILAHCLSRRLSTERWFTFGGLKEMSWARICILLVFLDSWLFLFASGVLVFGIGLESKEIICATGIYICVFFYATSKLLIYSFLVEKVFIVWSASVTASRMKSRIYLACLVMLGVYAVVIALMIAGRIHYLRESDGVCIIGLETYSSFTLLAYDLFVNIVLTVLFLWPVLRTDSTNSRLKKVAVRTLLASGVALTTSTVNILVLAMLHGHERGWICLGSCGADVICNALALFWVTKSRGTTEHTTSLSGRDPSRRPPDTKVNRNNFESINLPNGSPRTLSSIQSPRSPTFFNDDYSMSPSSPGLSRGGSSNHILQSLPLSPLNRKWKFGTSDLANQFDAESDIEMQRVKPKEKNSKSSIFIPFRSPRRRSDDHVEVNVTTNVDMIIDDATSELDSAKGHHVNFGDDSQSELGK